jgi:hypothetical protein
MFNILMGAGIAVTQYNVLQYTGRAGFDPWQRQRIFPLASVSRFNSEVYLAYYPAGTGLKPSGGMMLTSSPSSPDVKNE